MKTYFAILATILLCTGCTSYRITSDPEGAKIHYKGNITYKPIIFQRTPMKVRKGIEWPYGYDYVRVMWDGEVYSDWRLLDRDLHFVKGVSEQPVVPASAVLAPVAVETPVTVAPSTPVVSPAISVPEKKPLKVDDATTALKKLKELKDLGLLTDEEYETRRLALVNQL